MKDMAISASKQGELHRIDLDRAALVGSRKALFQLWLFLREILNSGGETVYDEIPDLQVRLKR